ncbi:hypothetical protein C4546_00835 [Candidatus Parcubacteria bacterium]|jgi:hypothetical protein|nr:MAG: hypothetical protein C4546_00835 [Candidatus Parcubacteria bacterium]
MRSKKSRPAEMAHGAETKNLVSILKLFPPSESRKRRVSNFVRLCYDYYFWYQVDEGRLEISYLPNAGKKRRETHDQVMAIIFKLFLQPNAEKLFGGKMPDRVKVREMIIAHYQKFGQKRKWN